MYVHAKKGFTGAYSVVNDKNEEYTHWILDKGTYSELRGYEKQVPELQKTIGEQSAEIADLKAKLAKANKIANDNYNYVQSYNEEMEAEKEKLKKTWAYVEKNKKDISQAIEVSRERANKDRGISDKKNNPGYRVISTEWYQQRYYKGKSSCYFWKTVIETPFFGSYDYGTFSDMWKNDTKRKQLFNELGIGEYDDSDDIDNRNFYDNMKDKRVYYRMDEKRIPDKYWQVTLYHTKELNL